MLAVSWRDALLPLTVAAAGRAAVEPETLLGRSRERRPTYARRLVMFVLHHELRVPIADIARVFRRDHATVLEGIRQIRYELKLRPETAVDVEAVVAALGEG